MRRLVYIVLILFAATTVQAGPFGLEMGWSYEECIEAGFWPNELNSIPGYYWDCIPPGAYPPFDTYNILIDDKYGVYEIEAVVEDISTLFEGKWVREDYDRIRDLLAKKYGEYVEWDAIYMQDESEMALSENWGASLKNRDRYLSSTWENPEDPNLSYIRLDVEAIDNDTCKIVLGYQSLAWNTVLRKHQQESDDELYDAL